MTKMNLPLLALVLSTLTAVSNALNTGGNDRRAFVSGSICSLIMGPVVIAAANAEDYVKTTKDFAYAFQPPSGFDVTNKPLKTHLEEVNFMSSDTKGYQFGVTVDPVRINSLKEFGSPEEVAARVVLAEVNRDGVFDVTLVKDPFVTSDGSYLLNYLSQGKRGNKHFVCKISVQRNKLYVLTAQVKEENYGDNEKELFSAVDTFRVIES